MSKLYFLPGALLVSLLMTACTTCGGDDEEPQPATCTTSVTVQYPVCNVAQCQQHPLLLTLPDGRQLNPSGTVWATFNSSLGTTAPTRLLIDYTPLPTLAIYTWGNADITCVSLPRQ